MHTRIHFAQGWARGTAKSRELYMKAFVRQALRITPALAPPLRPRMAPFFRAVPMSTTNAPPALFPREPPLQCTIFNSKGKVSEVAAQVDRKQFLRQNGLNSRDLRHIDGPQRAMVPYIQVQRGNNILVNICDLRVLIKSDQVFVFHSRDPVIAERLSMLVYDFSAKLGSRSRTIRSQDYEQMALEIVLTHAIAYLEVELHDILNNVEHCLSGLEHDLAYERLQNLLKYSTDLKLYHRRTLAVRRALDDALEDTSGLLDMYLTDSKRGENPQNYNDIEILIETYYSQADELVQKAGRTVREVSITEEIMNMVIDAHRNSLILFRLELSVLTVGLAFATFLADLYGMNLENFIEEQDWGMPLVSSVIAVVSIAGTIYNFKRLKYTRRVYMPHGPGSVRPKREALYQWLERAKQKPNSPLGG